MARAGRAAWGVTFLAILTGLCLLSIPHESRGDAPAVSAASAVSAPGPLRKIRPAIHRRMIPFGVKRQRQMARYSKRHYGRAEWQLKRPRQIVQHVAAAGSIDVIFNTFADNRPDPELGERPNVCTHFAISAKGRIVQMVGLKKRCRHTVGLNHVSIGIEHVGYRDRDVLGNRRQMRASKRLTRWLRCRFDIPVRDVIGHNENRSSRFHREKVQSLRNQTHGDFRSASMRKYRKQLRASGRCPR